MAIPHPCSMQCIEEFLS